VGKPPPRVDGATCRQAANGGQGACQQQVAPHRPPDKRRATSMSPIPQTLTFPSTDRHFGQSLSLACNTQARCVPPFKTQARTYFTAHFKLMAVQGDTQSLTNELRTSPQGCTTSWCACRDTSRPTGLPS